MSTIRLCLSRNVDCLSRYQTIHMLDHCQLSYRATPATGDVSHIEQLDLLCSMKKIGFRPFLCSSRGAWQSALPQGFLHLTDHFDKPRPAIPAIIAVVITGQSRALRCHYASIAFRKRIKVDSHTHALNMFGQPQYRKGLH